MSMTLADGLCLNTIWDCFTRHHNSRFRHLPQQAKPAPSGMATDTATVAWWAAWQYFLPCCQSLVLCHNVPEASTHRHAQQCTCVLTASGEHVRTCNAGYATTIRRTQCRCFASVSTPTKSETERALCNACCAQCRFRQRDEEFLDLDAVRQGENVASPRQALASASAS
jgi:hypothetical protein